MKIFSINFYYNNVEALTKVSHISHEIYMHWKCIDRFANRSPYFENMSTITEIQVGCNAKLHHMVDM